MLQYLDEEQTEREDLGNKRCHNDCEYMKIIYVHCSWRNELYRIDPRSYETPLQ